jgi:hypothetical protein
MIYVDYKSQERILKDSAYWYSKVISSNGKNLSAFSEIDNQAYEHLFV